MFSEQEKADIRKFMGMSRLFRNSNPILESAITAIEQMNDGGATETQMKATLVELNLTETQLKVARTLTLASEVQGEIKIDAARQIVVLRMEGTRLINGISFPLSMPPFKRYFYPDHTSESMDFELHGGSGQTRGW